MSRENADKFIAAIKAENRSDRSIYYAPFGGGYRATLLRYEDTGQTVYLKSQIGFDFPKGRFVDVFINYPLPNDESQKKKCLERFELYTELRVQNNTLVSLRDKQYFKKYRYYNIIRKLIGHKALMLIFEKRIFSFPEETATEWFVGSPLLPNKVTPKELWGTPQYIPFEDAAFPVAEHPKRLLFNTYGPTWFEIPSYAERGSHAFVSDFDIPYAAYDTDIDRRIDAKRSLKERVEKKRQWVSMLPDRNMIMPNIREMQGMRIRLELEDVIGKHSLNLRKMVESGDERQVAALFAPYDEKIESESVRYYDVYIDMPDEFLYAALYFSCFNGNYGTARRVLNQRRRCVDRELSSDLRRLCDICDATDELLTALYGDLNMDRTRELVDEWLAKEPAALYFQRADMNLRLSCDRRGESAKDLLRRCESYLEQYPEDGELLKYKGDILLELGEKSKGEKCYKLAQCNLKNGFCSKEIKEYFTQT